VRFVFAEKAWEDYLHWQRTDKKTLKRVNALIKEVQREPFEGIGKPEPLKHALSGYWSRRINDEHRIVYKVHQDSLLIAQLRRPLDRPDAGLERVAKANGFSLHACVSCEGHHKDKQERLCRYIARPAVAVPHLSLSSTGKVLYTLKTPYRDGTNQVAFEPVDFIARLAALVPKPRVNLTRYHGYDRRGANGYFIYEWSRPGFSTAVSEPSIWAGRLKRSTPRLSTHYFGG